MSLLDKWLKVKKGGNFHRKWKQNVKVSKSIIKNKNLIFGKLPDNNEGINNPCSSSSVVDLEPVIDNTERDNWLRELESDDDFLHEVENPVESEEEKNRKFVTSLREWANVFGIKHNAIKVLLKTIII